MTNNSVSVGFDENGNLVLVGSDKNPVKWAEFSENSCDVDTSKSTEIAQLATAEEINKKIENYVKENFGVSISKVKDAVAKMMDAFLVDINFKSENGYCAVAALNITATPDGALGKRLFKGGNLDEMLKKVNPNDSKYEDAKNAQCPEGTVKLDYAFNKSNVTLLSLIGEVNINMAMCLKGCSTDADCNSGNACIELPTSLAENSAKSRVCFDQPTVNQFQTMLTTVNEDIVDLVTETKEDAKENDTASSSDNP